MTKPMQPRATNVYDFEYWGYDPGTKGWTYATGLLIAAIIDWCTMLMPVRNHPPHSPNMWGWTVALAIVLVAPTAWLIGRAKRKDWNGVVVWSFATVLAVVFQLVAIVWARNY
jgi:hypothetical protein